MRDQEATRGSPLRQSRQAAPCQQQPSAQPPAHVHVYPMQRCRGALAAELGGAPRCRLCMLSVPLTQTQLAARKLLQAACFVSHHGLQLLIGLRKLHTTAATRPLSRAPPSSLAAHGEATAASRGGARVRARARAPGRHGGAPPPQVRAAAAAPCPGRHSGGRRADWRWEHKHDSRVLHHVSAAVRCKAWLWGWQGGGARHAPCAAQQQRSTAASRCLVCAPVCAGIFVGRQAPGSPQPAAHLSLLLQVGIDWVWRHHRCHRHHGDCLDPEQALQGAAPRAAGGCGGGAGCAAGAGVWPGQAC